MIVVSKKFNILKRVPTHTTIAIRIKKTGYYCLIKPKEKADDWILILDETIQLGQEKLLMIYGIRRKDIPKRRALIFTDLVPLTQISKKKWDGSTLEKILIDLKKELGQVLYAVGDHDSVLKKGLELAKIKHVHDITHKFALVLQYIYQNDEKYKELTSKMSSMRMRICQTEYACIMPPKQRKKSRYQNIGIIVKRGLDMLNLLKNEPPKKLKEKLEWILEYKEIINEIGRLSKGIKKVEKIIKSGGITEKNIKKSLKIFSKIKGDKGKTMENELKKHFDNITNLLPNENNILGTSDIIESAFGKYKNYLSSNYMVGITDLALSLSAFTCSLSEKEIQEALENTTMNDLTQLVQSGLFNMNFLFLCNNGSKQASLIECILLFLLKNNQTHNKKSSKYRFELTSNKLDIIKFYGFY